MGRLAHMHATPRLKRCALLIIFALLTTACGDLGSPVSITDRPLSERVADREATTSTIIANNSDGEPADLAPDAIAFSEALASGDFLRLEVDTNGVDTTLRNGPGTSYNELTTLGDGDEVLATGNQTGEWVYVVYGSFEGWISNRRLVIGDAGTLEAAVVPAAEVQEALPVYEVYGNAVGVNLRAAPNAQSNLVSGASAGEQVVGTGRTDGSWIEITVGDVTGWASSNYLRPIG